MKQIAANASPNKGRAGVRQVGSFSPEELEILRKLIHRCVSADEIKRLFPNRSVGTVRCKLSYMRAEAGVKITNYNMPRSSEVALERRRAALSSEKLLKALSSMKGGYGARRPGA